MSAPERAARGVLWLLSVITLGGAATLSCLRMAAFGDRYPPPPPEFYGQLFWTGLAMFLACIVAIITLLGTARPQRRGVIVLGSALVWIGLVAFGSSGDRFLDVFVSATLWLSPPIVAAFVLLNDARRARSS